MSPCAGDYQEALPVYEESLKIKKYTYGSEHIDVAEGLNNMGVTHRCLGNYVDAEALHEESSEMYQKLLGIDHPCTINVLGEISRPLLLVLASSTP